MSLDHELMVERLSSSSKPNEKTSKSEDELAKWQQQKQELMMQQNRDYMEALFKENSSRPIKINSVQVNNSHLFRESFILKQIEPLMQTNITTLEKFFDKLDVVSQNFKNSNGVENMYISLQESYPNRNTSNGFNSGSFFGRGGVSSSSSSALILSPLIHLVPVKRFYAKTGTNVGNGEGDGYIQFQLKNLFGGSESLIFDAITGTKTQSSYLLNYVQPIFNNSNYIFEQLFYTNTKSLDWLRSDSKVKGTTTKIFTQYLRLSINHDISLENCWRILSNNQSKSIDVLSQLGNDFKLSLLYNWKYDTRDNIHLPSKGSMFRLGLEYSGLFSSLCPSKYFKTVVELQKVFKLNDAHSLIVTNKSGLLHTFGSNTSSHVLDRFYIGGPNDVRSFLLNGLGPKSYNLSIGGDLFLNGGLSLISRIPKIDPNSNFKIHNFINFGKLVPLDKLDPWKSINSFRQMSISYGFGILYNHPMARFELNFVLPLSIHERDYTRKGFQYGIGVSFL